MAISLVKGGNVSLSKESPGVKNLVIGLGWDARSTDGAAFDLDASCFLLNENGKLSSAKDFIYYHNLTSSCGSIIHTGDNQTGDGDGDDEQLLVDLSKVPSKINKLSIAVTIHDAESRKQVFGMVGSAYIRVINNQNNSEIARYDLTEDASINTAMIFGDVYRHNGEWKFKAVGQGFNSGLVSLIKHYGGDDFIANIQNRASSSNDVIRISKVTLDKRGDKKVVSLAKDTDSQPIRFNLNWDQTIKKKSLIFSKTIEADLDLGCMVVMKDGNKGVIQALGNSFGSKVEYPYIYLDKDDRSGVSQDGENLYVLRPDLVDRIMIFAYIYEGTANFSQVKGRVLIKEKSNEIAIKLNSPDSTKTFCAICTLVNNNKTLEVTKEERYFQGHSDADSYFGFGFRWVAGSKD